jgi:Zn-dependent protease with chaperone function
LAALLACGLWLPSVFAQDQKEREIARAESRFTGKSLAEIKRALAAMCPEAVSQADKAILMRDLPLVADTNRVEGQHQLDRLYARLEPVLKLYGRYGVVDLIVFRNSQPIVYSKPGVVLVISTEVLKIVGNDDAALAGIVAHELAHEYVALQMLDAIRSRDLSKIRELELFCDAVAVVVLLDLGLDPTHYAKALQRIATHSQAATILNDGSNSHPEIEARMKVITDISALTQKSNARLSKTLR